MASFKIDDIKSVEELDGRLDDYFKKIRGEFEGMTKEQLVDRMMINYSELIKVAARKRLYEVVLEGCADALYQVKGVDE